MAEEKKYPYTTVPNNLRRLLEKLPTIRAPERATQKWLESIGFSGGNNKTLLPVLRHIGVIQRSGEPTEYWRALRAGDRAKFADAVRGGYVDLFAIYDDAHKQENDALQTFFRTHTDLGEKAQSFCVRTFKVLAEFGDFEAPTEMKETVAERAQEAPSTPPPSIAPSPRPLPAGGEGSSAAPPPISLTVNLQIELPPSAEGEVYDKLFAAMGKHLKGLITPPE